MGGCGNCLVGVKGYGMSVRRGPGAMGPGVLGGTGLASTRESLGSCLNNIWWVISVSLPAMESLPLLVLGLKEATAPETP